MKSILETLNLESNSKCYHNADSEFLVKKTVEIGMGTLSKAGALIVKTGKQTGRSAKDKFLVKDETTSKNTDWSHDVNEMTAETFAEVKAWALETLRNHDGELYMAKRSAGAISKYNVPAILITTSPSHNLFFNNMFRPFDENHGFEAFTVLHLPHVPIDKERFKLNNNTAICIDFAAREIIIAGTAYAGEIKKSIFSILNHLLPEEGVLPMHSGANQTKDGKVSVFFGLSGTGKTTLSADEGMELIGDDEHGLSDEGIFNFEGGCYAKTIDLSAENEPDIYKACHTPGTMLENVIVDSDGKVDFFDTSITENGRASYPLSTINDVVESGAGNVAKDVFFLCADAFGVLPPVARLNKEQAMYYFLSGYTAKLAGTEIGVTEPQATFSTCFGGPFMMRHPQDYGKLLGELIDKHNINVWFINTGWTGGKYGVGNRFPLKITRSIIRAIQGGEYGSDYTKDPIFGLDIPGKLGNVETSYLNPRDTWNDKDGYDVQAKELAKMFHSNFEKYSTMDSSILAGGPAYK